MSKFDTIYQTHYRQLFCIAARLVDDKEEIQDILQEVFTSYYEKTELDKQIITQPFSWLVRATLNKCIDLLERNKKRTNLNSLPETEQEEELLDRKQQHQILHKAIRELPPRDMELIVLYGQNFSYKEIADATGINYTSVGKTLSRSLHKLKFILKRMNYEMY